MKFAVTFYEGPTRYTVAGSYRPGLAEKKTGHPDTWHPAHGPEIDVVKVYADGSEVPVADVVNDVFLRSVQEALENPE